MIGRCNNEEGIGMGLNSFCSHSSIAQLGNRVSVLASGDNIMKNPA